MSLRTTKGISNQGNTNLVWDLNAFNQYERCARFVNQFKEILCVYSPMVGQIYGNYDVVMPTQDLKRLIILPNPYAYHDIIHNIPEDAISATGIHIVPGELLGRKGIFMTIPFTTSDGQRKQKAMPIISGVKLITQKRGSREALLPVLTKGDLKELKQEFPSLHLHRVNLDKLHGFSDFDKKMLADMIEEKLHSYLKQPSTLTK